MSTFGQGSNQGASFGFARDEAPGEGASRSKRLFAARTGRGAGLTLRAVCTLSGALLSVGASFNDASADVLRYTGPDNGNWNNLANWSLVGAGTLRVPIAGDEAILGFPLTVSTVNYTSAYSAPGLSQLTMDSVGHASILLNHLAGTMYAAAEVVGASANTSYYEQANGTTNVVTGILSLAGGGNSVGVYNLNNGFLSASQIQVGNNGTGFGQFTQKSGSVSVSSALFVGVSASGTNSYSMQGGTITLGSSANVNVGWNSRGTFSQSAGTLNLGGSGGLIIGAQSLSTQSTYNLSGGSIVGGPTVTVGSLSSGTFTQTGGTIGIAGLGVMTLGLNSGVNGLYTMNTNTGASSLSVNSLVIGDSGTGTYTHNAGSVSVNSLSLGVQAPAVGTYNLNSGSLSTGPIIVGNVGDGTINQTGGTLAASSITLGGAAGGDGRLTLSGGSATFSGQSVVASAASSRGGITQTGGSLRMGNNNALILGSGTNSVGSYSLSTSAGPSSALLYDLIVGNSGAGSLSFTGTASLSVARSLTVANSTSTVLSAISALGGTLTVGTGSLIGTLVVGKAAPGQMTQNGATVTVSSVPLSSMILGQDSTGQGTYFMQVGTLTAPSLVVGDSGSGVFNQSGGSVSVSTLTLANNFGSSGSYLMSGLTGSLAVSGDEIVGLRGPATFESTGPHTVGGTIQVGLNGIAGAFNMRSGNLTAGSLSINTATYTQTGGTANIINSVFVGNSGDATLGSLNISAGSLTSNYLYIGMAGGGIVNQTGGTITAANLLVNFSSGADGTYNFNAGTLNVTGNAYVGFANTPGDTATFYLRGGTATFPNSYNTGNYLLVNGTGTYIQDGGTLNGYVVNQGSFAFNGGTYNGSLRNDTTGFAPIYGNVIMGGDLVNSGTMYVYGAVGSIGAFVNEGSLTVSGLGQVITVGGMVNNGSIEARNIFSVAGQFTNNLLFEQSAAPLTLSASGGVLNYGTFNLATGKALSLQSTFRNFGSLSINGAAISGGGQLINQAGGVITGPGTIFNVLTNDGTLVHTSGALNLTLPWSNTGIVQIQGLTASLAGATMTNSGLVLGYGSISAPINNTTGSIESSGGTLILGGTLTNASGGTLVVNQGSKLFVSAGLSVNAGLISLSGGSFDNNSKPLNNTGSITGFGTLRTGGTGLTNNGSVTLTGGLTTVNGPVTNALGRNFRIQYNPAIFTGSFTNNGSVFVTSATATFAGGYSGGVPLGISGEVGVIAATSTTPSLGGVGNLTVSPGANAIVDGVQQSAITIQGSAGSIGKVTVVTRQPGGFSVSTGRLVPQSLSMVNTLSIAQAGSAYYGFFDLADNDLLIRGQSAASVEAMVIAWEASRVSGTPVGLGTSAVTAYTTLAVFPNTTYSPEPYYTTMGGLTLNSSDVIVKYTYYGDINIDGVVDGLDYKMFNEATLFGPSVGWTGGDFNHDGVVNNADLNLLVANLNVGRPSLGSPTDLPVIGGTQAIPEPAGAGSLLVAGMAGCRKRRR